MWNKQRVAYPEEYAQVIEAQGMRVEDLRLSASPDQRGASVAIRSLAT